MEVTRENTRIKIEIENYKGEKVKVNYPGFMYNILAMLYNDVKYKLDASIIITGDVGSGKTNIGIGIGGLWEMFFNRYHKLENIHFSAEDVVKFTDREETETHVCHFDESIQGGSGRDVISKQGNMLKITLITKRRKRHLYIFVVDNIMELSRKIIERSSFLIHAYYKKSNARIIRGSARFIPNNDMRKIYDSLKSKWISNIQQYPKYKYSEKVSFSNYNDIWFSEEEYDKKKIKDTSLLLEKENKDPRLEQRDKAIMGMLAKGMKQQEIANIIGLSRSTISDIKVKYA